LFQLSVDSVEDEESAVGFGAVGSVVGRGKSSIGGAKAENEVVEAFEAGVVLAVTKAAKKEDRD
jgi:hypothetical protein